MNGLWNICWMFKWWFVLSNQTKLMWAYVCNVNIDNPIRSDNTFDNEAIALGVVRFDSDSVPIKVDNCCTQSMSHNINEFIRGTLKRVHYKKVKGFGNSITDITYIGTLRWVITDDDGVTHAFVVPNSFLVPNSGVKLLSPQHWAYEAKDNYPTVYGTWCATYKDRVILYWQQSKYKKTIYLDSNKGNVATMWTKGGVQFYNKLQQVSSSMITACTTHVTTTPSPNTPSDDIFDDPNFQYVYSISHVSDTINSPSTDHVTIHEHTGSSIASSKNSMLAGDIPNVFDIQVSGRMGHQPPTAELLDLHHWMGHLSMRRLQKLAKEGILPKRLATCDVPICTGCIYGKMARNKWRTKGETSTIASTVKHAGDCISVDQLISNMPGLIAQLKESPTRERYRVATIFVDHHTDNTYVHLQPDSSAFHTLLAKHEFERHMLSKGVTVQR
jgi:hypothetical protein